MSKITNTTYKLTDIIPIFTVTFLLCLPAFFSGGRNFYIQEIVSWLVAASALLALKSNKISKNNKYIYLSLLSYIVLTFISSFLSISPYNSLVYSANYLSLFIIFLIASRYKFSEEKLTKVFEFFIWSSLIISGIGFYYFLTQDFPRITSTFYWPNPLAGYLLFTIPISLYLFLLKKSKLGLISFFTSILTLIFTGSRGAFLSLGVSFLLISLIYFGLIKKNKRLEVYYSIKNILKKNAKNIILSLLATLFIFILALGFKNNINSFERYNEKKQTLDYSSSIRLNYWRGAINIFKSYPVFGSGPDTFYIIYPKFQKDILSSGKYAHNWLLEILSENGLMAAIIFLIFLYLIYRSYFKSSRSLLNNFLLIGISASILHNLLDFDWHFYANAYIFYFILGLSINHFLNKENNKNEETKEIKFPIKLIVLAMTIIIIFKSSILIYENFNFLNATEFNNSDGTLITEFYFKKSIKFNNPEYIRNYLQYLISNGPIDNFSEANKISLKLLKIDQNFAYNNFLRGELMFLNKDYDAASQNFQQAIKSDRVNYPEFYYLLAFNYLKQGEPEKAKALLLNSIPYYTPKILNDKKYIITNNQKLETKISEKAASLYLLLANIYSNENNTLESTKFYNLAAQINPKE